MNSIYPDMKYGIFDWTNNRIYDHKDFETFEDAWGHIYDNVTDTDNAYDEYYVLALGE